MKSKEILWSAITWMNLGDTVLSEHELITKRQWCMAPFGYGT